MSTGRQDTRKAGPARGGGARGSRRRACGALVLGTAMALMASGARPADGETPPVQDGAAPPTLGETRLTLDKWIETQQIIAREGKDWQHGREVLTGRLELVQNEVTTLQEKTREAESGIDKTNREREELLAENEKLKAVGTQLAAAVTRMEAEVRTLFRSLPDPIQQKLQPLYERMPVDPATTTVSAAERFQNVLGILNEVNKANTDITVVYEVRELSDGRPAEVQVMYVGLSQAYYVSAGGEAGIGRPGPDGWTWESAPGVAGEVLSALDILQGKHSPAFVPLPVTLQ